MTTKRITKGDKVTLSPTIKKSNLNPDQIYYQKEKTIGTVSGRISQSVVLVEFPPTEYNSFKHTAPFMDVELVKEAN